MALRAIEVMKRVAADIDAVCPAAKVFNYTNPVNIVAQAWTTNTDIPLVSLCEGPIIFTEEIAEAAGLDPARVASTMVGLNHACWSVEHTYDGEDLIPHAEAAAERLGPDSSLTLQEQRILRLAVTMGAIPADYFQYYYWRDEVLAEQRAKPTTRAEDILSWVPGYWDHYAEQAATDDPVLDPDRSRGGINELELAIDAMHAVFNDTGDVLPVNVPNRGSLPGFPDDLVVEVTGRCSAMDRAASAARPYHPISEGSSRCSPSTSCSPRLLPGRERGWMRSERLRRILWCSRSTRRRRCSPSCRPPTAHISRSDCSPDGRRSRSRRRQHQDGRPRRSDGRNGDRARACRLRRHPRRADPEAAIGEIVAAVDAALSAGPVATRPSSGQASALQEPIGRRTWSSASSPRAAIPDPRPCGRQRRHRDASLRFADVDGSGGAVGTWAAIGSRNDAGDVFHRGWWPDPMGGEPIAEAALTRYIARDLGLGPPPP